MWNFDLSNLEDLQATFDRLLEKKRQLDAARPLPYVVLQNLMESLNVEWTYNSNSIEGNTLTLQETHLVLRDGITVKGKSLREHFEVYNHGKSIDLIYSMAVGSQASLSIAEVMEVHGLVLRSIEDHYAGRLRTAGVRISGANFVPPNARKVPDLLEELVGFVNENPLGINEITLVTLFHHKFVWIHPFFDGNGRTVRLLMNLLLIRCGFPPAIILTNDRSKYYAALNKANKGDYRKLTLLMAQALERSLNLYLNAISCGDENDDYLPIGQIVSEPLVPYGQEYVSLLARRGEIDAYKEGRNWVTSVNAVLDYVERKKNQSD